MRDSTVVFIAVIVGLLLAWAADEVYHQARMRRDPRYRKQFNRWQRGRHPW